MSTFLERIKSFAKALAEYVKSGGKLVEQNTADSRAATCIQCHNNKLDKEARRGCCGRGIIESAVVISTRTAIVGSRKTPSDKQLATCAICGCDNKLSVWFPTKSLGMTEENKNAYPSFCWRKEISD